MPPFPWIKSNTIWWAKIIRENTDPIKLYCLFIMGMGRSLRFTPHFPPPIGPFLSFKWRSSFILTSMTHSFIWMKKRDRGGGWRRLDFHWNNGIIDHKKITTPKVIDMPFISRKSPSHHLCAQHTPQINETPFPFFISVSRLFVSCCGTEVGDSFDRSTPQSSMRPKEKGRKGRK